MFKRAFIIVGVITGIMAIIMSYPIIQDVIADNPNQKEIELVEKWITENSQEWQFLEDEQLDLQRQNNALRAYRDSLK